MITQKIGMPSPMITTPNRVAHTRVVSGTRVVSSSESMFSGTFGKASAPSSPTQV